MRISHLFILLAASAMLTACDFLDEYNPNSVTVGNYYTSEEDIVASLNGVYTSLTQSYVADNYHYFTDVRANATVVTNSGANSGIPYQFYNYTLTEENVYVYNRSCTRSFRAPIRSSLIWGMSVMLLLRPAIRMKPKPGSCALCLTTGW